LGKYNKYKEKGLMNYSEKLFEEQEAIRLENTVDSFFSDFQVGRLLLTQLFATHYQKALKGIFSFALKIIIAENQVVTDSRAFVVP